jgi:hypothetical protein
MKPPAFYQEPGGTAAFPAAILFQKKRAVPI